MTMSIRPEEHHPHRCASRCHAGSARLDHGGYGGPARLSGRALGYIVTPANSTAQLRASASPACIFEVGDRVWLSIDPTQIVWLP